MKKILTVLFTILVFNLSSQDLFSGHSAGSNPSEPDCNNIQAFNFCIDCAGSYADVRELHQLNIADGGGGAGNCLGFMKGDYVTGGDPCLAPSIRSGWYSDDGVDFYFYDQHNWAITPQSCGGALPINLVSFNGEISNGNSVKLEWVVASQINNDYFTIKKTDDLNEWEDVSIVDGIGNTSTEMTYTIYDENPKEGVTYYRLSQTDYDGTTKSFLPIAITIKGERKEIEKRTNLLGQPVKDSYIGIVILTWDNGDIQKIYQNK